MSVCDMPSLSLYVGCHLSVYHRASLFLCVHGCLCVCYCFCGSLCGALFVWFSVQVLSVCVSVHVNAFSCLHTHVNRGSSTPHHSRSDTHINTGTQIHAHTSCMTVCHPEMGLTHPRNSAIHTCTITHSHADTGMQTHRHTRRLIKTQERTDTCPQTTHSRGILG